jgi:hypothetical protein
MINLIQKSNKCSNELDKVLNDKKLQLEKEKLITNIYSNKNQNNLDLCAYKKCKKVNKTLQDHKLKEMDDKYMEYIKSSANAFSNYYKCESLFNEFKQDKELLKKRISTFSIKDDKKRNKVIEKQVKLDKCNNISLKFIQEALKLNNNKIKNSRRSKIY